MNVLRKIEPELKACGLPYEIEQGKKHLKIRIAGRLIGILRSGGRDKEGGSALKRTQAQIRRAIADARA